MFYKIRTVDFLSILYKISPNVITYMRKILAPFVNCFEKKNW